MSHVEWLTGHLNDGVTIIYYDGDRNNTKYGRNLIEVCLRMAEHMDRDRSDEFLCWLRQRVYTSTIYAAPENMGSEWQAVDGKLREIIEYNSDSDIWKIWSNII